MQRERLTPDRIRRFTCSDDVKQAFLWDTEAPRLAVRVTTAGAKSFVFETKLHRQTIRITIGDSRAWNIDDARAEARRLQTLVDQGIDPREERAARLADITAKREKAKTAEVSVGEVWQVYLEARTPKWGARHLRNHLAMAKAGGEPRGRGRRKGEPNVVQPGPLRPLLSLKLSELDAKAVREWLEPLTERAPTTAAQTYRALRAFIGWAATSEKFAALTHADACSRGMARDVLPRAKPKTDCMQREQLALWFEKVRALANPVHAAYLQALLLTGARREELAGLRWTDVDFQWNSLTIRDKVEGERTIPLTPYVAILLQELKTRRDVGTARVIPVRGSNLKRSVARAQRAKEGAARAHQWVFSSPTAASGRLQEPRIAHNKALAAAGLPPLSLHGLRRSFGTLSEWVEVPTGIVAQIMGHKPSAIAEKHYRQRPLDLLRMWHTKIEGWILEQAGIEQPKTEEVAPSLRVVSST